MGLSNLRQIYVDVETKYKFSCIIKLKRLTYKKYFQELADQEFKKIRKDFEGLIK